MMRKLLILFLSMLVFFVAPNVWGLNFDDLLTPYNQGGQRWGYVPADYAGFGWSGWEVANSLDYEAVYGNTYNCPSLENFVYNGGDGYGAITITGISFDFEGISVSTWAQNDAFQSFSSEMLTVAGYNTGALVNSVSWDLPNDSFVFHSVTGFDNIDTLIFTSAGEGKYWCGDDLELRSNAVPEPNTLFLMGVGLVGLAGFIRRRINILR